jgi:acetyl esterase/lipase
MLRWTFFLWLSGLAGCATLSGAPAGEAPLSPQADYTVQKALTYTPAGWPQAQVADLYQPQGRGPFPAVIVVHGGGWVRGDRFTMDGISKKLAEQGFVALNIEYRLAPEYIFPAALQDVQQSVRWLRAHADEYHVDPTRVGVWGYSAGAELAALLGTLSPGDPNFAADARVQAVVAGGTPADLRYAGDSSLVRDFVGDTLESRPDLYRDISPIAFVSADDPPTYLYHGTFDWVVYQINAVKMKQALDKAGVPAELYLLHGSGHIATFLFSRGAETEGLKFLRRYLR